MTMFRRGPLDEGVQVGYAKIEKLELYGPTYNGPQVENRIWSIERHHFNDLNDSYPDFKVTPLFDAEYLRNGTRYRHSYNIILIETCTRLTHGCYFK